MNRDFDRPRAKTEQNVDNLWNPIFYRPRARKLSILIDIHVEASLLGASPEINPGFCTGRKRDGGCRRNRGVAGPVLGLQ